MEFVRPVKSAFMHCSQKTGQQLRLKKKKKTKKKREEEEEEEEEEEDAALKRAIQTFTINTCLFSSDHLGLQVEPPLQRNQNFSHFHSNLSFNHVRLLLSLWTVPIPQC